MVVGSREKQSLGRQGRVSAEATRVRRLALGAAAARRWRGCGEAHVPGQAGPRERGGYALRVTRYGKPTTRFGCSGRLLVSAVRGPRNSRSPPGVAGSLSPRGARRAGGRRCDRHQGTGEAIVQDHTSTSHTKAGPAKGRSQGRGTAPRPRRRPHPLRVRALTLAASALANCFGTC